MDKLPGAAMLLASVLGVLPAAWGARTDEAAVRPQPDSLRTYVLAPIRVQGRIDDLAGWATSASQGRIGKQDFARRPLLREAELLETVPGMIVTQHSGDGKANQMFLRGFNLDHGTDFRTEIEGMPVNMPSHGHGQGYTDLNFLIPEFVDHIAFQKGVAYAEIGDFGSAGAASFELVRDLDRSSFALELGEAGYRRAVGAGALALGAGRLLAAAEVEGYDGIWKLPQNLEKRNGFARYTWKRAGQELSILGMGYDNEWHASDQIPQRAIGSGALSPFGQIDSTLGGTTSRYSLSAQWRRAGKSDVQRANIYTIASALDLYSNFTYALSDTVRGDQFEQVDRRAVLGGAFEHTGVGRLLDRRHVWSAGMQVRTDVVTEVGLHRTRARRRLGTVRDDEVLQSSTGLYLQARSDWRPRLRTVLGLRGDVFWFDVQSSIAANSGRELAGRMSPKASLVLGPWAGTELYANGGLGFHSNDARGTTIRVDPGTGAPAARVPALVGSRGAELGVRAEPVAGLRSTAAVWALELDSELVFAGDAGTTEPSGASRRLGVELANFWRPRPWLSLDLDLALSRARFADAGAGADRIPGALERLLAAGVTAEPMAGVFGTLRLRHLGGYPLHESGMRRAAATALVNASFGFGLGRIRLVASVLNLFDSDGSDIQYFYASRLPGEDAAGVEDVHLHRFEPRQARVRAGWNF